MTDDENRPARSEAFDASPALQNQRLASYDWGSGELTFSPIASIKQDVMKKGFAEIAYGQTTLETEEDLTCLVALVHEYRHFQQDFFTGLGHWDYLARAQQIVRALSLCKVLSPTSTITETLPPLFAKKVADESTAVLHGSSQQEISVIGDLLRAEFGAPAEVAGLFTTRRLLEMDAVLYTYYCITGLRASDRAIESFHSLKSIYSILEMPAFYLESIHLCLGEIVNFIKEDGSPPARQLEAAIFTVRFILGLSLAYPDPKTLAESGGDRRDYLPGIRFVRLLRAAGKGAETGDQEASLPVMERALIANTGLPYVTYLETGDGWLRFLRGLHADAFPSLTSCRISVLERQFKQGARTTHDVSRIYSSLASGEQMLAMAIYDLPLFMRRTDYESQPMLMTGRVIADPGYDVDRIRNMLAWRLAEFLTGKRKGVQCPLFKTRHCTVQSERCRQPYSQLTDLPDKSGCTFRQTCFNDNRERLTY